MRAELALVFEEDVDGGASGWAHGEAGEPGFVEGDGSLATFIHRGQMPRDFGEITRQGALPAESVDAVSEGGCD